MHLAYKAYGDGGDPLIILHGLLGSNGNWHTLAAKAFAPHFRVYAVDQRNHGRSPHDDVFDYPAMVDDLGEFMEAHYLERAHVLGHSMGGKTAMAFALEHPARVDRLVVVDIAPKVYPPQHRPILDALQALDLSAYASRAEIDEALAARVPDGRVRQFLLKNLQYDGDGYSWQIHLDAIAANYERVNVAVTGDRPFDGPALFIRGGDSPYVADADRDAIRTLFPHARFVTIDAAGHWVHADRPDAFARAVIGFLGA